MAVSSGGGHWVELCRLRGAFAGLDVVYVSTDPSSAASVEERHYTVRNVTRRDRLGFAVTFWQLARILMRERPDVVVSTGAAPGLVALAAAKLLVGARTIWIDTIASPDRLSLSARLARPIADAWLTQWEHLARPEGPHTRPAPAAARTASRSSSTGTGARRSARRPRASARSPTPTTPPSSSR